MEGLDRYLAERLVVVPVESRHLEPGGDESSLLVPGSREAVPYRSLVVRQSYSTSCGSTAALLQQSTAARTARQHGQHRRTAGRQHGTALRGLLAGGMWHGEGGSGRREGTGPAAPAGGKLVPVEIDVPHDRELDEVAKPGVREHLWLGSRNQWRRPRVAAHPTPTSVRSARTAPHFLSRCCLVCRACSSDRRRTKYLRVAACLAAHPPLERSCRQRQIGFVPRGRHGTAGHLPCSAVEPSAVEAHGVRDRSCTC